MQRTGPSLATYARWLSFALVLALGVLHASHLAWLCDDAFISFRYARNLVDGLGLVFNPGERVEGYSNPLWTLIMAAALAAHLRAETASMVLGIGAYAAGLGILLWAHRAMRARLGVAPRVFTLPAAALIGALQPDWATFATSGLETSLFTTLALGGSALVVVGAASRRRGAAAAAGVLLGLASITRHEGVLLTALSGLALFACAGKSDRWRLFPLYTAAALLVWAPFTAWRWHYYGQLLPNTFYSKSGAAAYWSAGLEYVDLYLQRAWFVPLGALAALAAAIARVPEEPTARRWREQLGPGAAWASFLALGYAVYIARVGGDFMYARMLVPVTPLFLLTLDAGLLRFVSSGGPARAALGAAASLAVALLVYVTPCPVGKDLSGVVDERAFYDRVQVARVVDGARELVPFLTGIPVRVAIYGSQARLAYLAPFAVAIEAQNGLTDAHIAHQTLAARGRPGHEKPASFDYLIGERKADLTFSAYPTGRLGLDSYIPRVWVVFGSVEARLLHWDPEIVRQLRERGAIVDDFPRGLDELIARAGTMPAEAVARELERCDRFYFAGGFDPARRAALERHLHR